MLLSLGGRLLGNCWQKPLSRSAVSCGLKPFGDAAARFLPMILFLTATSLPLLACRFHKLTHAVNGCVRTALGARRRGIDGVCRSAFKSSTPLRRGPVLGCWLSLRRRLLAPVRRLLRRCATPFGAPLLASMPRATETLSDWLRCWRNVNGF